MPGAYAHISIVNDAVARVENSGVSAETAGNLGQFLKFVELGAVSPDYPYLALRPKQAVWADNMHLSNTATVLKTGIATVRGLKAAERSRVTAWLFGYAAHMTADMTIHPVIQALVGPYEQNKAAHRQCEMHQDSYIFPKIMNVGETALSQHLATGIAACTSLKDPKILFEGVTTTWIAMLKAAYPEEAAKAMPDPNLWHSGFVGILSSMAAVSRFLPLARHVAANQNLAYPQKTEDRFLLNLPTPLGEMSYQQIYERARANVLDVWGGLDQALRNGSSPFLDSLQNWNLDSGCIQGSSTDLPFWSKAA